jgi:uncharacterized protein (DUF983 family)
MAERNESKNRVCPSCTRKKIPVASLILSQAFCPACGVQIRVRRFFAVVFFVLTFSVTAISFVSIMAQQGIYAAIIWLPLPIGALGYIKARFCPLRAVNSDISSNPRSQDNFV